MNFSTLISCAAWAILLIILTAFAGAGLILAGFFLAFGRILLADLQFGEVGAIVRDHWIWGVLYLALAGVGVLIQWGTTEHYVHDATVTGAPTSLPATAAVAASTLVAGTPVLDSPAPSTATSTNGASLRPPATRP